RLERVHHGAERSYLFQVARNVALHARRTLARRREVSDEQPPEPIEAHATPEYLAGRREVRRHLERIIAGMNEPLRAVFTLFELGEMTLTEIADLLATPVGTVSSRLRRARAQFRSRVSAVELAWEVGAAAPPQKSDHFP